MEMLAIPAESLSTSDFDSTVLLDGLPDVVLVLDTTGSLRYVNEAAERQFGWTRAEWIGRSVLDILHPDDLAVVMSSIGTMQSKEFGTPVELRVADADGGWHWSR